MTTNGIERLSPEESAAIRRSMTHTRKADPLRDALADGEVVFVPNEITSGRIQGLRYWAKVSEKRLICRTATRRDVTGTYVWLVDR